MNYKLFLLVLCTGFQGAVQAEGGFFSGMKNKISGWFGKDQKPENSIIKGSVKQAKNEELAQELLAEAGEDAELRQEICDAYPSTEVCQKIESENMKVINTLKAQKIQALQSDSGAFNLLEMKARSLIGGKIDIKTLCRQKPEIQEMLEKLFPGKSLSCEQYVKDLKVKLAKENAEKRKQRQSF